MTLIKKAIPYILVIISLLAAFLVFQRVNPEWLFKQDGPPVTLTQISKNIAAHYAGQTAGADILRKNLRTIRRIPCLHPVYG